MFPDIEGPVDRHVAGALTLATAIEMANPENAYNEEAARENVADRYDYWLDRSRTEAES